MAVKTSRLEKITRAFNGLRVGVLGDLMLDELVRGEATRISPEAPVPVVLVRDGREAEGFLGGSGNVAANVAALGGRAAVFGVIGRDSSAQKLKALLRQRGIDSGGVVEEAHRVTPRKVRIVAHQHQLLRVDFEHPRPLSPRSSSLLAQRLARRIASLDTLIISDYLKGSVAAGLCSSVMAAAHRRSIPVLVDPKPEHAEICRQATVVTPNQREAEQMAGMPFGDPTARQSGGPALLEKLGCEALLITRGGEGMTLVEGGGRVHDIPSVPRPVYDVTGAGDTVIAVMALSLAAGASLTEAAHLANIAGGCVVLKFGTAVIAPDELRDALGASSSE